MNDIMAMLKELRPENDFSSSVNFFEDGLLDSFDLVSLVTNLEDKYGIMFDPLDMVPENFQTIDTIINVVKKNGGEVK